MDCPQVILFALYDAVAEDLIAMRFDHRPALNHLMMDLLRTFLQKALKKKPPTAYSSSWAESIGVVVRRSGPSSTIYMPLT